MANGLGCCLPLPAADDEVPAAAGASLVADIELDERTDAVLCGKKKKKKNKQTDSSAASLRSNMTDGLEMFLSVRLKD